MIRGLTSDRILPKVLLFCVAVGFRKFTLF